MNLTESIRRYYEQLQPKYITWEFYEKYIDVEPPFGQLGLVVFLRTYSRYIKDLGRREKFCEVCLRVVEYSLSLDNITSVEKKKEEAALLYDDLFNLRSLCAGRTLWVANTKITAKDPSANFNCTASTIKDLTSIVEGFYLLLVGAGFGFSVEKKYIEKLPKFYRSKQVTHKDYTGWVKGFDDTVLFTDERFELTFKPVVESKDNAFADYYGFNEVKHVIITVGDSKEGWVMALKSYLAALTSPTVQTITFDYNWVRPEGELLKTFGGRSSGYKALQQLFDDIYTVTQELDSDDGQQLNSAQVMDLVNAVGLAVVVGGVRRSSQLVLADEDDKLIRDAKKNLWSDPALENKRRTRVMSNNSLALYDNPGLEWFQTVIDSVKTTGEPGFISVGNANKKDPTGTRKVFNPCFAAGTMVMTREGHYPIEELVGKKVEVYDGEQWVEINNFRVTGENQEVWKVIFHNGQELTATPYHTFILENGERVQLRDLTIGQKLKSVDTTVEGGIQVSAAYIKGFLLGDGTHIEDRPLLSLYEPKYQCETRLLNSANELPVVSNRTNTVATLGFEDATAGRQSRKRMTGLTARNDGDLLNYVTTYREHLPKDIYNWNLESKCQFLAGLFDADGTAKNGKNGFGYQLSNVNLSFLQDVQLLLLTIGISSKIGLMRKGGVRDFGAGGIYPSKDCYRLGFTQSDSIELASKVTFNRLISFSNKQTAYKLNDNSFKIANIQPVGIVDKVYCCTVPTNNCFTLSNTLLVRNCAEILLDDKGVCNLTEVYLPKHIKEDGRINYVTLERSLGLATRMGSRITLVEMFHKDWNAVQKRDRLLGVSLSGVVDFFDLVGINTPEAESKFYAWCKKIVHNVADTYHDELGIEKSLLKTTIKPSGTLSTLVGCGSGIHRSYAPYYYRRVRVSVNDPIAMALKDMGVPVNPENGQGETINDDGVNTWVFTFPVKTDTKIKAIDESAITQLERYRNAQVNYVDHNVSFTCSVDIDEWDDVATWLYENYDDFIGVSFLPKFDSTNSPYPQLPYEVCEKEQYEELKKDIPSMSENGFLQVLQNYEKLEDEYEILEDACGGKGCPLR